MGRLQHKCQVWRDAQDLGPIPVQDHQLPPDLGQDQRLQKVQGNPDPDLGQDQRLQKVQETPEQVLLLVQDRQDPTGQNPLDQDQAPVLYRDQDPAQFQDPNRGLSRDPVPVRDQDPNPVLSQGRDPVEQDLDQ